MSQASKQNAKTFCLACMFTSCLSITLIVWLSITFASKAGKSPKEDDANAS